MTPAPITLDGRSLAIGDVVRIAREPGATPRIDSTARDALVASRRLVEQAIASGQTIYGINTGFGKLANVRIAPDRLDALQVNLIRSHAAGVGAPLAAGVVRAVMLLRANVLLRPTSGVRPELVEALVAMLDAGIVPLVPEQGSVGASGDLAPLSHIALALMGEGDVLGTSGPESAADALRRAGLRPFRFAPKEGLAFINGTQAQTALLALLVHDAEVLWRTAVGAAAMSLEALRGTPAPLDPRIHEARPHRGQLEAAELMRGLLADSEIRESHRENDPRVQDAYSLRCAPQVLGAVADAIRFEQYVTAPSGGRGRTVLLDADAVADLGAGGDGGVDEDRVEHRATRRVQRVDAVRRLDRDRHDRRRRSVNVVRRTGGVPAATIRSSRPQRWSCSTPPRISAWVDRVSAP